MNQILLYVVFVVIVGFVFLAYKRKEDEGFLSAVQTQTIFANRSEDLFQTKLNKGIFISPNVSLFGLNDAVRQPDMDLDKNLPQKDMTKFFIRDPTTAYSDRDRNFCRGAKEPRYLPTRSSGSTTGCGWWYVADANTVSVGALGTRRGPLFPENLPAGGQWVWNTDVAQEKEDIKLCKKVRTCDILDVTGINGRCGFCKRLGYAVPITSNGEEKYPNSQEGSCGAAVTMTSEACYRPESVELTTPDGVSCGTMGRPSADNNLRLYNKGECDTLGGNLEGNGECRRKGGGTFSWDCRTLNSPANVTKPPVTICDPLPTGRLSKACLMSLAKGIGYTEQGAIYRILYNGMLPEETDILAINQMKLRGITIPKAILGDGDIDKLSAGNIYKEIYDTIRDGRTNVLREAAKWLTIGTDKFDVCDVDPKATGPYEPVCVQRAFRQVGCQASGTAYPTSATVAAISNMTWEDVNTTFTKLRDATKSTDMKIQDKAARECLGIAFQRVPPKHCSTLPDRPAPVVKSSLPGLPQPSPKPTLPWDIVNRPNTTTNTWDELNQICGSQGKRLCSSEELCPSNQPITEMNIFGGADNWMAVNDKQNEWLTYNQWGGRLCKTHTVVDNRLPAWGNSKGANGFFRAAKCCPTKIPDWNTIARNPGWSQICGGLTTVSVGSDNHIWGTNSGSGIYRKTGTDLNCNWEQVPGGLIQVECKTYNQAVGVNTSGGVYYWNGNWTHIGERSKWVSIGEDGTIICISTDDTIWKYNGSPHNWSPFGPGGGRLKQISVASITNVWGVNSADNIYRWNVAINNWEQIPGGLSRVAVSPSGNTVVGVNSGGNIYGYNGTSTVWTLIPGGLTNIHCNDNFVVGANSSQGIYYMRIVYK